MRSDGIRLAVNRSKGHTFDGLPDRDAPTPALEVEVTPDSTFGEVWDALVTTEPQLGERSPGGFAWGTHEGQIGYFFDYVGGDGHLYWGRPWHDLRVFNMARLYPTRVEDWRERTFTFVDYPQLGQGYDLDWNDFVELYNAIRPLLEGGVLLYGTGEILKHLSAGARRKLATFGPSLKGLFERWRRRGGHAYEIRDVIANNNINREDKLRLLGLADELDLEILQYLLSPSADVLNNVVDTFPEEQLLNIGRSGYLVGRPTKKHYTCACDYEECAVQGAWVATARGLKLGLTHASDHFIFPASSLSETREKVEAAYDRETRLSEAVAADNNPESHDPAGGP